MGQSRVQSQWSTPPIDCFKVNFDGATFPEMGKAGLGVVIRNWQGNVMASLSEQAPLPFSPDIVKAMATAKAISFAQELGICWEIDVHEIYTIKYSHIYIFSLTFMLFCD